MYGRRTSSKEVREPWMNARISIYEARYGRQQTGMRAGDWEQEERGAGHRERGTGLGRRGKRSWEWENKRGTGIKKQKKGTENGERGKGNRDREEGTETGNYKPEVGYGNGKVYWEQGSGTRKQEGGETGEKGNPEGQEFEWA